MHLTPAQENAHSGFEESGRPGDLIGGLVARAYDDAAIQKILGGNLLRLFRDTLE